MVTLAALISSAALLIIPITAAAKFGAVGIPVSSLDKSRDFYAQTLGLAPNGMKFQTTEYNEIILQLPGTGVGSALVLMQYHKPREDKDPRGKLVFYVDDVKATVSKMKTAGAKIVAEPGTLKMGNTTIPTAFAKDLDGHTIELNPMTLFGAGVPKGAGKGP